MVQTQSACLQAEPGGCLSIFTRLHLSICIQWWPAGFRLVLHGWVQKSGQSLVSTLPSFVNHTGHFTSALEQHRSLWLETAVWTQKSIHIRGSWKWCRGNFSSFPPKVVFRHHCSSLKGPMNLVFDEHGTERTTSDYYVWFWQCDATFPCSMGRWEAFRSIWSFLA